jgi:hypothetical protein
MRRANARTNPARGRTRSCPGRCGVCRHLGLVAACLAVLAVAAVPGHGVEITLQGPAVVEDARLMQTGPGADAGNLANGDLLSYDSGIPTDELAASLIRFDLSNTPIVSGSRITRARLSVYLHQVTPANTIDPGRELRLNAGRVLADWDESVVSRDVRLSGSTSWANTSPAVHPFGDHYNNGDLASVSDANPPNATIPLGWHTIDSDTFEGGLLLEVMQDIFDNPADNHGFVLWHSRFFLGSNRRFFFYSSETGEDVGGQNLGPKLELTFIPEPGSLSIVMLMGMMVWRRRI